MYIFELIMCQKSETNFVFGKFSTLVTVKVGRCTGLFDLFIDRYVVGYQSGVKFVSDGYFIFLARTGLDNARESNRSCQTEKSEKFLSLFIFRVRKDQEDTLITRTAHHKSPHTSVHFYIFLGRFCKKINH